MQQYVLMGLGNPGEQFSRTRHNLGADSVATWIAHVAEQGMQVSDAQTHEKFHANVREVRFQETVIAVLDSLVFMNESGKVLASYLRYHPVNRQNILIIHDDLELSLGDIQFQNNGSAHGHNGMRSLHEYLGDTNIPQLRIGIGRPSDTTLIEKFVLSTFTPEEKKVLEQKEREIVEAITRRLILQ